MTHTALDQLKTLTTVVADSSDLDAIRKFRPLDATTNPSLITAAAEQPESKELIEDAYYQAKEEGYSNDELIERTIDILTVKFGVEILKLIEGRVSTEIDASLSYDTEATTQVMGWSFRSIDQVLGLAGCDLLTISPSLLTQLEQDTRTVDAALDATQAKQAEAIIRPAQDEQSFKDELNHDLMAFQLLQGGVDGFIKARDQLSLLLRQSFGIDAEIKS